MIKFCKANIITGHYGCGKTNFTVNAALQTAEKGSTAVIDLDTVNPYFRSEDFRNLFTENGIDLYSMNFAGTNLDIPSFDFEPFSVIKNHDYTFIDVGGDDSGAFALGRFSGQLESLEENLNVFLVINMYRDTKDDVGENIRLLKEIETAARLKATAVINNSNLGEMTNYETVKNSLEFARKVAEQTKLPLAFTCIPEEYKDNAEEIKGEKFFTKRIVKMPWEGWEE